MGNCACDVGAGQLDPSAPLSFFFLELTPECNNSCLGCGNVFARDRSRPPLSASEWARVIDRIAPLKPRLRLTGGEPTLHPEFEKILRHVQSTGLPYTVFSNARWHNPEQTLDMLTGATGLEGVLVSLHGARAESHEAFTNSPGSFEETTANIRRATRAGLNVVTSSVIMRQNFDEIARIVALSEELGAHHTVFSRYIGPPMASIEPDEQQLITAVRSVEDVSDGNGRAQFGSPVPRCFTSNHSNGCMAGFVHATIDPWGCLRPCPHVPITAGNVLEEDFNCIWHAQAMETWRSRLLAQCDGCASVSVCRSACLAQAYWRETPRDPLLS